MSSHVYKKQHVRIFSVLCDYRNDVCVEPDFFAFSSQMNDYRTIITPGSTAGSKPMISQNIRSFLLLGSILSTVPIQAEPVCPNILLLIADDWAWPHASIAGEPELKTPVFDRVAREGLLFTNAFASAPSCTASRAALLTGQYHWRLEQGASLHQFLPAKFQVYPDILEQSQYQVGFSGKGWGPGDETMGGRIRNPAGNRFADFDDFLSKRTNQKPFCFWYGSPDPHRPYSDGSGIRTGKDPKVVRLPQEYPDDPLIRSDMLDYYTEIERFDQSVGEILKKLEKSGELDQTLVVITSDNGRPFPRGKATLYDAGTHVPLAIRWPGGIKSPGRVIDDFVSLTDLAPTFLDLLDLKGLPGRTGRSLGRIFGSSKSGWIDPDRSFTLTGMERHTACRELEKGNFWGGYPMRDVPAKTKQACFYAVTSSVFLC